MLSNLFKFNRAHGSVALIALLFSVAACSQLSEEECLYMSWQARGVMEGIKGTPANKINEYQRVCDKFSIQVDYQSYEAGRQEGVKQYCTVMNGFNVGLSGNVYQDACTVDIEQMFLDGYTPGRMMYLAVANLDHAKANVNSASSTIANSESHIERNYQRLYDDTLSDDERREIQKRIREHERRIADARERRVTYQVQIPDLRARCQEVKRRIEQQGFQPNVNCY